MKEKLNLKNKIQTLWDKVKKETAKSWAKIPWEGLSRRRRELIIGAVIVVLALIAALSYYFHHYTDFDVTSTEENTAADEANYIIFKNHLLKYSADGAFYTGDDGNVLWNITYDMSKPTVDICEDYLIIYDKNGTSVYVVSESGQAGHIETAVPITEADVANKGEIAVLMQEQDSSYIELYDIDGNTLASGEIHTEKGGYPVALALSSDSTKMMVSMINLNDGNIKSAINFYDFSKAGQDQVDNLVATYSYADTVIPDVDYVKDDKAIAFGDREIIIFSEARKPKVEKEIFPDSDIKSILHNDKYFGTVTNGVGENGEITSVLTLYNMKGKEKFSKTIDIPFNNMEMMENNEILVNGDYTVNIFTPFGFKKFEYTFDNTINNILPGDGYRNYIFVLNGTIENVKLK